MLVFEEKDLQANTKDGAALRTQKEEMLSSRRVAAIQSRQFLDIYGNALTPRDAAVEEAFSLHGNAGKSGLDFWRETDRTSIQVKDNDQGREFLTDIMGLAKPLSIGKTSNAYAKGTDLSKNVERSMDFKVPVDFDHNENVYDSDPIPTFTAGYGVNFRKAVGGLTEGIDFALDAQALKMKWVLSNIADYMLTGDSKIKVDGAVGQGVRNHRNTYQVNMGSGTVNGIAGANIDLTTASNDEVISFFNQYVAARLDDNYVPMLDQLWVSPEIYRVLQRPFSASAGFKDGLLIDYVLRSSRIGAIKQTFKLSGGRAMFGYVRSADFIRPLVGASVAVVPMPRLMPQDNYNFMIYGAMGLQIRNDYAGHCGVFNFSNVA